MAPQSWTRGPVCGVDNCRSRLYRSTDGLTICQFGHVMEGNIEINDDQDQAVITTRRLNVVNVDEHGKYTSTGMSNSQSVVSKRSSKLYGTEAKDLYFLCLQILLKKEVDIFVNLFFSESIRHDLVQVVKLNWIKCLGVIYNHESNEVSNGETAQASNKSDGNESDDDYIDKMRKSPNDKRATRKGKTHTVSTLDLISIIYLSALQLKFQPLYVNNLVENIKSNQIPYARTLHLIPKSMMDKLPMPYHNRLQPPRLPSHLELYHSIKLNGSRLHSSNAGISKSLAIPLNFYYPFVFNVFSEVLLFPHAIDLFNMFTNLMGTLEIDTLDLELKDDVSIGGVVNFPEVRILGAIIFIAKLTFVSNPFSSSLHPLIWLDKLNKYEMNNEYSYMTSNNRELLDWSDDKIDKYCNWIYEHIIPKKNKTYNMENEEELAIIEEQEELNIRDKRLFQIFNMDSNDVSETPAKRLKLDAKQHDDPVDLSIKEVLIKMTKKRKKNTRKVKYEDIIAVEGKLLSRLSDIFWVTPDILARSYESIERQVKKDICDKNLSK
ncbi:uncharacterized protein RJT20DRAFT_7788 [Scheffersomyces xylosifermentans]|uniref:uncharacterized protein n=1 Tax=Scheffersomyces xylosifermentans TaxID=1304137 RepID=UPI00315CE083